MNPQASNNGTSTKTAREIDPQAPKTKTDEKMARHFDGIIFGVLIALALGVLIAIWILHHRGQKGVPHAHPRNSAQQAAAPIHQRLPEECACT